MSASQKLIAVVAAVVIAVVSVALHLPPFVAPLVVVCAVVAYVRRNQSQAQQAVAPDSDCAARLQAVTATAGIPTDAVVWVAGPGRPYVKKRGTQLLISLAMVAMLNDQELLAMVQLVWVVHPAAYWIAFARSPALWLMLAGIIGQPFLRPTAALILIGFLWTVYLNSSGKITDRVAREGARAFLARGGEMQSLLAALTKNYTALMEATPAHRGALARIANRTLHLNAQVGGISDSQLVEIMQAAGGAPDMLTPPRPPQFWRKQSPYWPLTKMLILIAVLALSVAVAVSLSK